MHVHQEHHLICEVTLKTSVKNEIKSLTGIRGIFAVYVMLFHINPFASSSSLLANGYISVDLFFILSGFILSFVYEKKFKNGANDFDYIIYLIHRFTRIYPLYLFILILVSLFYFSTNFYPTIIYDITTNVLFMQSVTGNGFIGPAWSLSTEVIAYFLVPFMILLIMKKRSFMLISTYASLCMLGYVAYSLGRLDVYTGWQAIARCLSEYILGVSSYCFYKKINKKNNNIACFVLTIISLILLSFRGFDLFIVIVFTALIPLIASSNGVISKILSCTPVFYLGEISYSIYLWHGVVSRQFSDYAIKISHTIGISNSLITMVIITIFLSCISYHLLEIPCKNYLKKRMVKFVNS